jgi:hypothetical protein
MLGSTGGVVAVPSSVVNPQKFLTACIGRLGLDSKWSKDADLNRRAEFVHLNQQAASLSILLSWERVDHSVQSPRRFAEFRPAP